MRRRFGYAACLLALVLPVVSACGTARVSRSEAIGYSARPGEKAVVKALYRQLSEWEGVRYRYGGLDKSGVDCSGFVQVTLKQRFGLETPRSTKGLSGYGVAVSRGRLRAGDLVFFRTGRSKRHVGIYVEDDRFLHASTSRGVTLSDMESRYWKRRYWQARRVLMPGSHGTASAASMARAGAR